MADMDLAAAYAAGAEPPPQSFAPQRSSQPPRHHQQRPQQQQYGGDDALEGELPSIDDLEVAAAAAGVAPVPALLAELGYFEMGPQPEQQQVEQEPMEESSEEEDDSSLDEGVCWRRRGLWGGGARCPCWCCHKPACRGSLPAALELPHACLHS